MFFTYAAVLPRTCKHTLMSKIGRVKSPGRILEQNWLCLYQRVIGGMSYELQQHWTAETARQEFLKIHFQKLLMVHSRHSFMSAHPASQCVEPYQHSQREGEGEMLSDQLTNTLLEAQRRL